METNYFLFNINQHLSAIKAEYVAEVFALPELILIPDSPLNIVGLLNLRGEVLPILDFQVGHESNAAPGRGDRLQPYRLTDSIIVLSQAQLKIGLVVNAVQGMRALSSQAINPEVSDLQAGISPALAKIVAGTIADEDANEGPLLIFNEPNAWFSGGEIQQFISVTSFLINDSRNDPDGRLLQSEEQSSNLLSNPEDLASENSFCPTATPEERIKFRQRADNLKRSLDEDQPIEGTKTLVVITLNDQLFGIDSQNVREFITIRQATPIPCCPTHIIGNINFRGEILTVVDICKFLNISPKDLSKTPKAIVVECGDMIVGIVVEEILDAMFSINEHDIKEISDTPTPMLNKYIQGTALYNNQMIHILDLKTLFLSDELVVDEMV